MAWVQLCSLQYGSALTHRRSQSGPLAILGFPISKTRFTEFFIRLVLSTIFDAECVMIQRIQFSFLKRKAPSWLMVGLYLCALAAASVHAHAHCDDSHHNDAAIEAPPCGSCADEADNHLCSVCQLVQSLNIDFDGSRELFTECQSDALPIQALLCPTIPHQNLSSPRAPPAVF